MANRSKSNQNLQMFKKNALPDGISPRNLTDPVRTNTTYNYNFREPIEPKSSNNQEFQMAQSAPLKPMESQQVPNFPMSSPGRSYTMNVGQQASSDFSKLQQEAEMRSMNRIPAGMTQQSFQESLRPKGKYLIRKISS